MATQSLELGKRVPSFILPIAIGGVFNLESAFERGPVVLNFIRGTWCEFCTEHLTNIQKWKSVVEKQKQNTITIAVISNESPKVLTKWQESNPINFLLLSDEFGKVARDYGFRAQDDDYSRPAMIVIDKDGSARVIDDGFEKVDSAAKEINREIEQL